MKICELEGFFPNRGAANFGKDDITVKMLIPTIYQTEVFKWLQVSDRVFKVNVTLKADDGVIGRKAE